MDKKSFIVYNDYEEHFNLLNDEELGALTRAMIIYSKTTTIPKLSPICMMAFSFIKSNMDRDKNKWEDELDKRKTAGKLGGIASGKSRSNASKNEINRSNASKNEKKDKANRSNASKNEANEADNVTVTVTVTDTVTDTVINNSSAEAELITKIQKIKFGKFGRIKLTLQEYEKLVLDFGKEIIDNQITELDEYVETNNNKNKYNNFNLVIRKSIKENWFKSKNKLSDDPFMNLLMKESMKNEKN